MSAVTITTTLTKVNLWIAVGTSRSDIPLHLRKDHVHQWAVLFMKSNSNSTEEISSVLTEKTVPDKVPKMRNINLLDGGS